jgi:hypothetical protein
LSPLKNLCSKKIKIFLFFSACVDIADWNNGIGVNSSVIAMEGEGPTWNDCATCTYAAAWDGDVNTYYDYYESGTGAWTQIEFSCNMIIDEIRYYPRTNWGARMVSTL